MSDQVEDTKFVLLGHVSLSLAQRIYDLALQQADWQEIEQSETEFDRGGGRDLDEVLADANGPFKQVGLTSNIEQSRRY
jgi:hypothetical protein